ncbi:MAG: sulfotransferase [Pleurocapsa sp.]
MDNFAFIIGAMKCGTTSLFNYLAQHPEISACTVKEPDYFSSKNDVNWSKGWEWYKGLWNWDNNIHQVALEASVNYTKIPLLPNAAERIAQLKKDCKFIYILRNPIERIESHYIHGQTKNWTVNKQPLEQTVHSHLIEVSKYAKQIDEYSKRFPPEKILILSIEDLKSDTANTLAKVCKFLEIDSSYNFQGIDLVHNANQERFYDSKILYYLKKIGLLQSVGNFVPTKYKQTLLQPLRYQVDNNIRLSEEQREFVLQELQDDLKKLSMEYGFDTSRWNMQS